MLPEYATVWQKGLLNPSTARECISTLPFLTLLNYRNIFNIQQDCFLTSYSSFFMISLIKSVGLLSEAS